MHFFIVCADIIRPLAALSTVGRGVACERAQWLRGDPESRKTFGEEERQQSGFRCFAKRNTEKAEFAATKRTGYGAGAGESRREERARRPLRQEDLDPAVNTAFTVLNYPKP